LRRSARASIVALSLAIRSFMNNSRKFRSYSNYLLY
jgi:hypothetical protein